MNSIKINIVNKKKQLAVLFVLCTSCKINQRDKRKRYGLVSLNIQSNH